MNNYRVKSQKMKIIYCGMFAIALSACAPLKAPTPATKSPVSAAQGEGATTRAAIIFGSCEQKPVYPQAARDEKRVGTVFLAFHVDVDNTVMEAKVHRSSGHADLDEAARVGLAKCKFRAATKDGVPVRDWVPLRYTWVP